MLRPLLRPAATRPRAAPRLALLAALAAAAACAPSEHGVPKNLLFVVFDTTRADHLSAWGHPVETSPTVDALARRGARFENAYSQSSLTPVSAGSFLTGTLPARHGVRSLWMVADEPLDATVESFATRLAARGMRTAAFVSARPMGAHYGLARGFETYDDRFEERPPSPCGNEYQRRADETAERALEWLSGNGLEPFALMVHFFDAHDATLVPPRDFLQARVSFPLPAGAERPCALTGLRDEYKLELYDAEIAYMDAQLARLLERIERLGALEETLVVLLADHGEGLGDHGHWTHGWLHREQLHVPLVMAGPGIAAGREVATRVRLVDLVPTLYELFDAGAASADVVGASLLPLVAGDEPGGERDVYGEVHHALEDRLERDPAMYSLTRGDWKLIHRPRTGAHELYDLARDPRERNNLYADDHPRAGELVRALEALGAVDERTFSAEDVTPEQREALEELGYLGDG